MPTVEPRSVILKKRSRPAASAGAVWVLTCRSRARTRSHRDARRSSTSVRDYAGPVEFRDDQPMQHEFGNRTYFVADVEPLDVDGVRTVEVGTRCG